MIAENLISGEFGLVDNQFEDVIARIEFGCRSHDLAKGLGRYSSEAMCRDRDFSSAAVTIVESELTDNDGSSIGYEKVNISAGYGGLRQKLKVSIVNETGDTKTNYYCKKEVEQYKCIEGLKIITKTRLATESTVSRQNDNDETAYEFTCDSPILFEIVATIAVTRIGNALDKYETL